MVEYLVSSKNQKSARCPSFRNKKKRNIKWAFDMTLISVLFVYSHTETKAYKYFLFNLTNSEHLILVTYSLIKIVSLLSSARKITIRVADWVVNVPGKVFVSLRMLVLLSLDHPLRDVVRFVSSSSE